MRRGQSRAMGKDSKKTKLSEPAMAVEALWQDVLRQWIQREVSARNGNISAFCRDIGVVAPSVIAALHGRRGVSFNWILEAASKPQKFASLNVLLTELAKRFAVLQQCESSKG